jgi:ABC-type nitrate/sulfonate/bicarbonate transport system permease component
MTEVTEKSEVLERTEQAEGIESKTVRSESKSLASYVRNPWVIRAAAFLLILALWQEIGSYLPAYIISTPTAIASAFVGLAHGTGPYDIVQATVVTLEETFIGFVLSIVIGLPLGIFMGMSRSVDTALDPYVNALYVLPRVAMIPLIIIWFGVAFSAVIATVVMLAVFPIIINTYAGMRNISKPMLEAAQVFGVKGFLRFRRVIFPATVPFIMSGLRLGIGAALIGVIVAQMLLSLSGLGYMIYAFSNYLDTAQIMALLIELMILGVVLTFGIQLLERKIAPWKETERAFR